jgi:hypothetical protein
MSSYLSDIAQLSGALFLVLTYTEYASAVLMFKSERSKHIYFDSAMPTYMALLENHRYSI